MAKEQRTQALDYFATTLNALDEPYLNRRQLLFERAKVHDLPIDKIILDEKQAQEKIAAQTDSELNDLMKQKLRVELGLDVAKTKATDAKTVKTLADAGVSREKAESDMDVQEADAMTRRMDAHSKALDSHARAVAVMRPPAKKKEKEKNKR
jgi:hypothetical protein